MDIWQAVVLILVLALLFGPYYLVLYVRKKKPENYATAMILSVVCSPVSHYYLGSGGLWFLILAVVFVGTKHAFGYPTAIIAATVTSALVMHFRFQRVVRRKTVQPV